VTIRSAKIQETPRFAMAGGAQDEADAAVAEAIGTAPAREERAGNTIASPEIIKLLSPTAGLVHSTLITLLIFVLG
jgi:hypothetical protein